MGTTQTPLPIKGLGKEKAAALVARAKRLGMTPHGYIRHLIDEDLAISERARSSSFEELLGPGEPVGEAEIDRAVEDAKRRYHRSSR